MITFLVNLLQFTLFLKNQPRANEKMNRYRMRLKIINNNSKSSSLQLKLFIQTIKCKKNTKNGTNLVFSFF